MTPAPRLTDPLRRAHAVARARMDRAGFLHAEAKLEIQEKLIDVNRTFTNPAVVSPFPDFWRDVVPDAVIVPQTDVLDLEVGAHDLVIHAMGLHWADDPVGQLVQARRALRPDGLLLAVCFGGETLTELRQSLTAAETEVLGGLSPRVAPMAEVREIGGLLGRAGFALPVADRLVKTVSYESVFGLFRDLRDMGETNALADRHRRPAPRALFLRAAELYAAHFFDPANPKRIQARFELVFLSGWAPHESQPEPLRPGSAKTSLADALNATNATENPPPVLLPTDERG